MVGAGAFKKKTTGGTQPVKQHLWSQKDSLQSRAEGDGEGYPGERGEV